MMSIGGAPVVAPRHHGASLLLGSLGGAVAGVFGLASASLTTVVLGGEALQATNALGAAAVRWLQIGQPQAFANFYPDATLGGLVLGLLAGALVGAPLAAFIARFPEDHPAAWGLVAGLLLWVVARWVLAPALNPAALRIVPGWAMLFGHLGYGLAIGIWLASVRPLLSPRAITAAGDRA
jgi:hypothetical protein